MKKKVGSLEQIIYYGLETINEETTVNLTLKDFIIIYRAVEEFRRFFHNKNHYLDIESVNEFIGNKESGMINIINKIYLETLDKLITDDIEKLLESDSLDSNLVPFYYSYFNEK